MLLLNIPWGGLTEINTKIFFAWYVTLKFVVTQDIEILKLIETSFSRKRKTSKHTKLFYVQDRWQYRQENINTSYA